MARAASTRSGCEGRRAGPRRRGGLPVRRDQAARAAVGAAAALLRGRGDARRARDLPGGGRARPRRRGHPRAGRVRGRPRGGLRGLAQRPGGLDPRRRRGARPGGVRRGHARRPAVHHLPGDRGRARPGRRSPRRGARDLPRAAGPSRTARARAARPRRRVGGRRRVPGAAGGSAGAPLRGRAPVRPDGHRHAGGAGAAMKLEQSFEVQAPIDAVWEALIDLERVAPCLPGATITGHDDDGTYHGEFKVKLGPTTASYRGTVKIEEADEASRRATLKARGTDKRGQGGANATIVNTLTEEGGGTRVEAVTDFTITGRLARFGRGGMIEDISNRLMRDFATCLQSRIAIEPTPSGEAVATGEESPESVGTADDPPAPATPAPDPPAPAPHPAAAEPISGFSLFFGALLDRIKRLFK